MNPHDANQLRLLFWETTTSCNLRCVHCRACASEDRPPDELDTSQSLDLLKQIADFAKPVVVLSGGEPLVREDIFDLAEYGNSLGLRMALATNGTTLTREGVASMVSAGIQRVSVSIDGADSATHDSFRQIPGAFDAALRGLAYCVEAQLPVQINTTVARHNIHQMKDILDLAISRGACALHLFLLVPTGCGAEISESEMISAQDYEEVLAWLYDVSRTAKINVKATCAPHYYRVMRQKAAQRGEKVTVQSHGMDALTRGCLAGTSVCFVSYKGDVYPCGYFPLSAGNVLETPLRVIWQESDLFARLRDFALLEGKCGACEFVNVCGGCRARAYAETGDYLAEEPYCAYIPKRSGSH